MNRDAAREAGVSALRANDVHDDSCERGWESGAMAWTPCGCALRAAAAVIDAALPHLVGEPVGYGVATPLGRAVSICATLDGAHHLRDLLSEDSEGGLRVVALIPVVEP